MTTLSRGMARAWARHRLRVNAVAPGLVETPKVATPDTTPEAIEDLSRSVPLGRSGKPEDHVGATVLLASDPADYITGTTVNVSGGFLIH